MKQTILIFTTICFLLCLQSKAQTTSIIKSGIDKFSEKGITENKLVKMFESNRKGSTNLEKGYWHLKHGQLAFAEQYLSRAYKSDSISIASYYLAALYNIQNNPQNRSHFAQNAIKEGHLMANFFLENYSSCLPQMIEYADGGDVIGQRNLGTIYLYGYGLEKNYDKGIAEFNKAALQGDAIAQNNLGEVYELGYGVEPQYNEAVKWYKIAAKQGFAEAQNNLGIMYLFGRGVEQDDKQAYKWFALAAKQGFEKGQLNLDLLPKSLGNSLRVRFALWLNSFSNKRTKL